MKTISKQLIIIRGPVGGGKTSVVETLRLKLADVSIIDFDAFKRQIDNSRSSVWRREIALDTALYLCDQLMKIDRLIIVDIHSSQSEQFDRYVRLADKHGYKMTSFHLHPPLATCIERAKKRVVPDITYEIDEKMIEEYWNNAIFIEGEMVFDDPDVSPEEIADEVIKRV